MRCVCLALDEGYIRQNMAAVRAHACDVEQRQDDDADMETLLRENRFFRENYENVFLIRKDYETEMDGILHAMV